MGVRAPGIIAQLSRTWDVERHASGNRITFTV